MKKFAVIIPAAGQSSRFRDQHYKKPYAILDQKAVWLYPAERFLNRDDVGQLVLVVSQDDKEEFFSKFGPNVAILGIDIVQGGKNRADSVLNGLKHVEEQYEYVVIHDAARPCVTDEQIDAVLAAGEKSGAAILATPITDTIKNVGTNNQIESTFSRTGKWLAQTPQVFRRLELLKAFENPNASKATDEAELMEKAGKAVTVVEGSPLNIKITTKADLSLAKAILKVLPKPKLDAPAHPFADDHLWR